MITIAYLQDRTAIVPDKMVAASADYTYHAVRGYSSLVAAQDSAGAWVGFVDVRDLGFETARGWLARQGTGV